MQIEVKVDDARLMSTLRRMMTAAMQPQTAMQEIAALGESSTRMRFRTQIGPDGVAWKKGRKKSGRTLTKDGHLSGSISSRATQGEATWGVNRVYAAIHQFGGVIKPRTKKALRFRVAGGGFVTAKQVTIPARPFLGISRDDREDILHLLRKHYGGGAIAG
jgi:phage virion morphogenesis protein